MKVRTYLAFAAISALSMNITTSWALPPRQHSIRGVIEKIDRANGTITLKSTSQGQPALFVWNDHTRFEKPACCAGCSLSEGQTVLVRYRREVGKNVLREVSVKGSSAICRSCI
jgi:Cu/Ag efflux protein CusF